MQNSNFSGQSETLAEITMQFRMFYIGLSCLVLFIGCSPTDPNKLPGRYVAEAEWGKSSLELRPDGTFVEEATLKGGGKKRVEGKWEPKLEGHVTKVSWSPCLRLDHAGINDQNWDYCARGVDTYITGQIEISLDPDFGFSYQRKE